MKRFLITTSAAALYLVATATSAGVISGSAHDFSTQGWGTTEICEACHAPHNNLNAAGELLWNHEFSTAIYTVYSSPTFSAAPGSQPSGSSKLCLSCHDGTVSLDSFGGTTGGSNFIGGKKNFGTDLGNDHPISFPYTVAAGEELHPTSTSVTFGDGSTGTIADMLFGPDVECSSCHDVHNTKTAAGTKLLVKSNAASALCLTCHAK